MFKLTPLKLLLTLGILFNGFTSYALTPEEVQACSANCHQMASRTFEAVVGGICSIPNRIGADHDPTWDCICSMGFAPSASNHRERMEYEGMRERTLDRLCPSPLESDESSSCWRAAGVCLCNGMCNCICSTVLPLYYCARIAGSIAVLPLVAATAVPAGALIACPCEVVALAAKCIPYCLLDENVMPGPQAQVMPPEPEIEIRE